MCHYNVIDDGPAATAEDKLPSSSTVDGDKPSAASTSTPVVAAAEDNKNDGAAKDKEEGDNTSLDVPVAANQQPQINVIPELPDATSNAFTQMVLYASHGA